LTTDHGQRTKTIRPAPGCRKRLIHATRSAAYGCSLPGLTRFATFLWVGPLPAPQRGPGRRARDGPHAARFLIRRLRDARLNDHLLDEHGFLGVADPVALNYRHCIYFTRHVQPRRNFSERREIAVEQ